jgi:hypothetical protein
VAFLLFSLFSVNAFTLNVEQLVPTTGPGAVTQATRVALLIMFVVNGFVAYGTEMLSGHALALYEWLAERWRRRQGGGWDGDGADAVALLAPGAAAGSGGGSSFGGLAPPSPVRGGGRGPGAGVGSATGAPAGAAGLRAPVSASLL